MGQKGFHHQFLSVFWWNTQFSDFFPMSSYGWSTRLARVQKLFMSNSDTKKFFMWKVFIELFHCGRPPWHTYGCMSEYGWTVGPSHFSLRSYDSSWQIQPAEDVLYSLSPPSPLLGLLRRWWEGRRISLWNSIHEKWRIWGSLFRFSKMAILALFSVYALF